MAASFQSNRHPALLASRPRAAANDTASRRPARRTLGLAGVLFVVAFGWASGLLDKAAAFGIRFFDLYVESQLAMIEAADNVADGRAEYAVLLDDATSIAALEVKLEPATTVRYERESVLPGWIVVSVEDGDRDAVAALKSAEFARLVVPNRGLWICH